MLLPEVGSTGAMCDLHLLAATGGGERRQSNYVALLNRAGFTFDGVRRLSVLPSVVAGLAR